MAHLAVIFTVDKQGEGGKENFLDESRKER